jgi:hypothetical protein
MATYDVLQDFGGTPDISTTPCWVIMAVRFKYPVSYMRSKKGSFVDSTSAALGAEAKPLLIIQSSVLSMMTQSNKGSHCSMLDATLAPTHNWSRELLPGDWIVAWMHNSPTHLRNVIKRATENKPCNKWNDGLKFVGRVQSCRKSLTEDQNGKKTVRYRLQGKGFSEFDSQVFFDPYLALREEDILDWMGNLGIKITEFLTEKKGVDVNKAVPTLLEVLFGRGLPPGAPNGKKAALQIREGPIARDSAEAPYAYVVPSPIGGLLGKTSRSKPGGALAYADILEAIIGLQRYEDAGGLQDFLTALSSKRAVDFAQIARTTFVPDGIGGQKGLVKTTEKPLLGSFLPSIPQFTGKTVWTILDQFTNPAVNEMYTCLRVNWEGNVVPHLIMRQLPFSTPAMKDEFGTDTTPYLELPRWKLHPALIKGFDIGRSDVTRFNFSHVYGQSIAQASNVSLTTQLVDNPPVRDPIDIQRNGMRADFLTVACDSKDQDKGPAKWMAIRSDFLMGQHLRQNGTVQTIGIHAPICEGDNIEVDDLVLHIEGVMHQCGLVEGKRSFITTLAVSHGMPVNAAEAYANALYEQTSAVPDEALFGLGDPKHGISSMDPGYTIEDVDTFEDIGLDDQTTEKEA